MVPFVTARISEALEIGPAGPVTIRMAQVRCRVPILTNDMTRNRTCVCPVTARYAQGKVGQYTLILHGCLF